MTDRRSFFGALAGLFAGFGLAKSGKCLDVRRVTVAPSGFGVPGKVLKDCGSVHEGRLVDGQEYRWEEIYVRGGYWAECPSLGDLWHGGRKVDTIQVHTSNNRFELRYHINSTRKALR